MIGDPAFQHLLVAACSEQRARRVESSCLRSRGSGTECADRRDISRRRVVANAALAAAPAELDVQSSRSGRFMPRPPPPDAAVDQGLAVSAGQRAPPRPSNGPPSWDDGRPSWRRWLASTLRHTRYARGLGPIPDNVMELDVRRRGHSPKGSRSGLERRRARFGPR